MENVVSARGGGMSYLQRCLCSIKHCYCSESNARENVCTCSSMILRHIVINFSVFGTNSKYLHEEFSLNITCEVIGFCMSV